MTAGKIGRVCVIGYYSHNNLGDESYKASFYKFFEGIFDKESIVFYDCDSIASERFAKNDLIVLGGGDVLNDYFIDKIIFAFNGKGNKIIAVSVGLPYKSVLTASNKLNILDYIFVRTKVDLDLFKTFFHPHKVHYLPDISHLIPLENPEVNLGEVGTRLHGYSRVGRTTVGIMLSRHIYHPEHTKEYTKIIKGISRVIRMLLHREMHVVMIPFNTNDNSITENDMIINSDVLHELARSKVSFTHLTQLGRLSVDEMLKVYDYLDYVIPMRFHACLFALYKKVPFIPLFTTRKIKNLLVDIDWNWGYELPKNEIDIPTGIDEDILYRRLMALMSAKRDRLIFKMTNVNIQFGSAIAEGRRMFMQACDETVESDYESPVEKQMRETFESIDNFIRGRGYTSLSDPEMLKDPHTIEIITSIVSFKLTKQITSDYTWGLRQKMFVEGYDWKSEWRWIINDVSSKGSNERALSSNSHGLFDLGFVDQEDYSGVHRSGWQYVYSKIKHLHRENADVLLDMYVDRTFHWNKEINRTVGLIPYKRRWMGFIHHTFDTTFSDYNCVKLMETPEFLESLQTCCGLFVLSEHLGQRLREALVAKGYSNVRVYPLTHPTEIDVANFSLSKFMANEDKKVIHVGGWLRNIYSFYRLEIPRSIKFSYGFLVGDKTTNPIINYAGAMRKVALKGKGMDNYYPSGDFLARLRKCLEGSLGDCTTGGNCCPHVSSNCCRGSCVSDGVVNNWYREFLEDTVTSVGSVDFIHYLENEEYDKLLTENIVFINLIDASAVNTVIECVARNTPIIVNKHPAVVEILGADYPLYYNANGSYSELNATFSGMLRDTTRIKRAYLHLKRLDKTKLSIEYFVADLIKTVTGILTDQK